MNNTLQKDLFCCQQRKTLTKVKTHLMAKDALCACSCSVAFLYAVVYNAAKKVVVLFHKFRELSILLF